MINVTRTKESPKSLCKESVQTYLNSVSQYQADPENNEEPVRPRGYRDSDILEAFDKVFFSKCYLTEEKFFNSWELEVDHFIPFSKSPELALEWTNLYPVSRNANSIKSHQFPKGGVLDPCKHDVEKRIIYGLDCGFNIEFDPRNPDDELAKNTCELLIKIHHGPAGAFEQKLAVSNSNLDT